MKNKKVKPLVPTEEVEQRIFVEWMELKRLRFTAIPNSTYTTSWKIKQRNTDMGVRAGLPDLLVVTPKGVIFVEMKRALGGQLTVQQREWIEALNKAGTPAHVCRGAEEAISTVEKYLKNKGTEEADDGLPF